MDNKNTSASARLFSFVPCSAATHGGSTRVHSPSTFLSDDGGLGGSSLGIVTDGQSTARQRKRVMASKSSSKGKDPEKSPTPTEGSDTMRSARRRVCDLCSSKKIKCDMLKPQCSNCILYGVDCTTTIARKRKTISREQASISPPTSASSPIRGETRDALESRLARIESQLQQVLSLDAASKDRLSSVSSISQPRNPRSASPLDRAQAELGLGPGSNPHSWTITPTQQGIYEQLPADNLAIPPLEDIAHVVNHFFNAFNTVTPLFCRASFMVMLGEYYNDPISRNKGSWAAIQIVIAIGYRTPNGDGMPLVAERAQRANTRLQSAQSVMSHLVTRDDDMLGVQVLLGIVILFLNSSDFKPAAVMIGNAVRLAYQLGLHEAKSQKHGPPGEAEQRGRVFWIAYVLDRGLSLRTKTPHAIMDDDIDVPLPPLEPGDGTGLIWIPGGHSFNYFRSQIDLAHIEGKTFELLHSIKGAKIRGSERDQRVRHLQDLLDRWYERVPPLFQIENLVSTLDSCGITRLTKMFHEYQFTVLNLHSLYNTQDAEWVHRLSTATSVEAGEFSAAFEQMMAPCRRDYPPPSRAGWEDCVGVSRACMKLFHNALPTENIVWHCSCPLYAGTLVLLTNILLHPTHPLATLDQYMCNKSMALFERLEHSIEGMDRNALRNSTFELLHKANAAIEGSRSGTSLPDPTSETLGGGSHEPFMESFSEGFVPSMTTHQTFDMSLLPAHGPMFDNTFRQVEFGMEMHGFDSQDIEALGVPTTDAMAHMPDFTRYTGDEQ